MSPTRDRSLWIRLPADQVLDGDTLAEPCVEDHGCDGWHELRVVHVWRDGATAMATLLDDAGRRGPARFSPDAKACVYAHGRKSGPCQRSGAGTSS